LGPPVATSPMMPGAPLLPALAAAVVPAAVPTWNHWSTMDEKEVGVTAFAEELGGPRHVRRSPRQQDSGPASFQGVAPELEEAPHTPPAVSLAPTTAAVSHEIGQDAVHCAEDPVARPAGGASLSIPSYEPLAAGVAELPHASRSPLSGSASQSSVGAPWCGSNQWRTQGMGSSSPSNATPEYIRPKTWASLVKPEETTEEVLPVSKANKSDDNARPKNTILDCLLFLSHQKAGQEGSNSGYPALPEEMKKFKGCLDGIGGWNKVKYNRRGIKNDANNCYMSVVIQSMLSCSSLMQLLSHCAAYDPERPFYTCLHKLCREFHSQRHADANQAFNVLALPQVKAIISTWQSIGAQQDAGEFLFYMLNGLHEECKWNVTLAEAQLADAADGGVGDASAEAGSMNGKTLQRSITAEIRAAGAQEDSPIARIFGGMIRSSVRAKSSKADSVSLEPFNHISVDISAPSVDSVWTALESYCNAETVNEGRATKRLQFSALPKVLILTLKRFAYNKETGIPQKIKKAVKYDERLVFDRTWLVDGLEPQDYQLTAVICHHGESANGGHYNSAVRYNNEWFMYDDALVRPMNPPDSLGYTVTAYLLVYQSSEKVSIKP